MSVSQAIQEKYFIRGAIEISKYEINHFNISEDELLEKAKRDLVQKLVVELINTDFFKRSEDKHKVFFEVDALILTKDQYNSLIRNVEAKTALLFPY